VCRQLGAQCGKVRDVSCVVVGGESGGLAEREGSVELARGKSQNTVAMCLRHRENKIGVGGDLRRELSRGETGYVTPEVLEDERRFVVNGMCDDRAGPSARRSEVRNVESRAVCRGKSFRRRRPTDVSGANEEYVQGNSSFVAWTE
jgi:hypothetical protein